MPMRPPHCFAGNEPLGQRVAAELALSTTFLGHRLSWHFLVEIMPQLLLYRTHTIQRSIIANLMVPLFIGGDALWQSNLVGVCRGTKPWREGGAPAARQEGLPIVLVLTGSDLKIVSTSASQKSKTDAMENLSPSKKPVAFGSFRDCLRRCLSPSKSCETNPTSNIQHGPQKSAIAV